MNNQKLRELLQAAFDVAVILDTWGSGNVPFEPETARGMAGDLYEAIADVDPNIRKFIKGYSPRIPET